MRIAFYLLRVHPKTGVAPASRQRLSARQDRHYRVLGCSLIVAFFPWAAALGTATVNQAPQLAPGEVGDASAPATNMGFAGQGHRVPMVCDDPSADPPPGESKPLARPSTLIGNQHPVNGGANPVEVGSIMVRPSGGTRESRSSSDLSWRDGLPLVIVLGVIAAMALLLRRFLPNQRLLNGSGAIEVVARTGLSSKQQLVLIKVGRRLVLLGVSAERINPLSEVVDPDEVAMLIGTAAGDQPGSMRRAFADTFEREVRSYDEPSDEKLTESVSGQVRGLLDKLRRHTRPREAV